MGTTLLLALIAASRIVVTEVMANPKGVTGAHMPEDRNEFVELYNPTGTVIDLAGWTVSDGDAVDVLTVWTDSSLLTLDSSLVIGSSALGPGGHAIVLDPEYTDTAPTGGFVMPYRFGGGTLILTVGNTTIGDGLTTNDPLVLGSADGDTSTFGTPSDTTDSIPCDAGNSISWERIDVAGPDEVGNWTACRDTAGCTPGSANSSTTYVDLAITGVALSDSTTPKPGEALSASIVVANSGFRTSPACSICVFLDRNGNTINDGGEYDTILTGQPLLRGQDTILQVCLVCPSVTTDLCARLLNADDDTTNNFARLAIIPGGSERLFDLNLSSFSPDGDGFEDSLAVLYHLPDAKGTLKVVVFNLAGRQVATLFSGNPPAVNGAVCWNGLSSSGARAPTGIYAIRIDYRCGNATRAEKLPVVLLRK